MALVLIGPALLLFVLVFSGRMALTCGWSFHAQNLFTVSSPFPVGECSIGTA